MTNSGRSDRGEAWRAHIVAIIIVVRVDHRLKSELEEVVGSLHATGREQVLVIGVVVEHEGHVEGRSIGVVGFYQ